MPGLIRTVDPTAEPVSVTEAKAHARITHSADDTYLGTLIEAARDLAERQTGLALLTQTWRETFDWFPSRNRTGHDAAAFDIARAPLISVSSITYYDENGDQQTVDSSLYVVDTDNRLRPRVTLAHGQSWPGIQNRPNAVSITYVAGYGATSASVPPAIRHAVLLMLGHWYENREAVSEKSMSEPPFAVRALLDSVDTRRV